MAWYDKPTLIKSIHKDEYYIFGDESGDIKGLKSTIKKYASGEAVKERDSTFSLTTIFISPKCLESLYATFQNIKRKYLPDMPIFHGSDINNRKGRYSSDEMGAIQYQSFITELIDEIKVCKYSVQVTHFNKWQYVVKHNITKTEQASHIIASVYKKHFKIVDSMLKDLGVKAALVLEESSDKKLDMLVLKEFVKMRKRKTISFIKSLYFTRKDANLYPSGTELADIIGQSMFNIFCHPICLIGIKKTYSRDNSRYLDFYEFK